MKIASAGNTIVPAYLSLLRKGIIVSRERADTDTGELWHAEAGGNSFIAEDLVQLLGLVALFEVRCESWKASGVEIERFLEDFPE